MNRLKIPPHSLEAEQSVLGSMMIDDKCHGYIITTVKPEHFYNQSHIKVYSAVKELLSSKSPVDLITVTDYLERKGELESVGGFAYVAELARHTPTSANAKGYADIIVDRWNGRMIIAAANEAVDRVYAGNEYRKSRELLYDDLEKLFMDSGEECIADGFDLCVSFKDELERIHSAGGITGWCTGDKHIDEATGGFQPGDYIGLAARSGGGKTTKALNILAHFTRMQRRSLFFSMEMKRQKVMMKLVSDMANVPFAAIKKADLDDLQWHRVSESIEFLKDSKLHVDDSSGLSIDDIERKARHLKAKYGHLDLIVLDYVQRLKIDTSSMYSELTKASNRLKDLFMELNCAGIVLAQLKKNSTGFPNASDLRETGAIENDSDCLIFLHTPSEDLKPHKGMLTAEIFNKVRFGETGIRMLANELDYQRFRCSDAEFEEDEPQGKFR